MNLNNKYDSTDLHRQIAQRAFKEAQGLITSRCRICKNPFTEVDKGPINSHSIAKSTLNIIQNNGRVNFFDRLNAIKSNIFIVQETSTDSAGTWKYAHAKCDTSEFTNYENLTGSHFDDKSALALMRKILFSERARIWHNGSNLFSQQDEVDKRLGSESRNEYINLINDTWRNLIFADFQLDYLNLGSLEWDSVTVQSSVPITFQGIINLDFWNPVFVAYLPRDQISATIFIAYPAHLSNPIKSLPIGSFLHWFSFLDNSVFWKPKGVSDKFLEPLEQMQNEVSQLLHIDLEQKFCIPSGVTDDEKYLLGLQPFK